MGLKDIIRTWSRDVAGMIWPRTCAICGCTLVDGEELLCLRCYCGLPLTGLHKNDFNSIHQRLAKDVKIERAGAMIRYQRQGEYSGLIRQGKYNSRPEILRSLASLYSSQLKADDFFDGIDIILPVPMHFYKKIKRGYNQSEVIAKAISQATGIPVGDNLKACRRHSTQTHRSAFERHSNVKDIFEVRHPYELEGKHLLLVDDVITTGATLHSCALSLTDAVSNVRISVVALATATL